MNKLILIGLIIAIITPLKAQEEDLNIWKLYTFQSKILSESRKIAIHVPNGYETSDVHCHVLYVLDGEWHFTYICKGSRR